ncbi:TPR repeat family, partial [Brachionus plicatilis]
MNSFESYDVFISYKWDEHKSNVHFMADQLEKRNLRVWLDRNKIKESEDLSITMKNGIDQSELFICCVTENYCDFESPKNKNCKSEFNYAFSTNKKILYVIFADVKGLGESEIIKKFNAVGFRMSGSLFYIYSQSNLDEIFNAIQLKKQKIIKVPLNHYLPNQTNEYVRKTKLEEKITHLFEKTNVVIITGSSGMGKTSLAVNYGRELANNERKIVRFINSKNKDSIFDSLRKILYSLTSIQQKFGESEIIEHLILNLDRYKVDFFFIIDNLSEFNHIKRLIEQTNQNVNYLITTQIQDNEVLGKNTEKIDMSNFDNEETYQYLMKNLKRKDKTEIICSNLTKVILETSDNRKIIPIYLVQVVQHLNENKEINLKNFITNFKDEKFDIMTESLRKIREANKPLWSLLKFASILEGSFIHYKLLKLYLNINAEDKKTLGVLITSAQQYSLLKEDYDEENEYGIQIHELIQKGIQNKAKSLFKNIKKIANILDLYYQDESTNPDSSWLNSIYSINHAKKLIKNKDLKDKNIIISLNRKISHINKEQEIEEGIKYYILAAEIETDDKNLTINYYEKSLDIKLKVSISDYSSISKTYNSLGTVYCAMGEYNKAIKYHKNSLEIQLKTFKDDHPYIGDTYNNLGNVYDSMGEYNKAIEYYEKSLEIKLKNLNINHP